MRHVRSIPLVVLLTACATNDAVPTKDASSIAAAPASTASATSAAASVGAPPATLPDLSAAKTTYFVFDAFMSPTQQPGEESDAPKLVEKATGLEATAPTVPREARKSTGYGRIRFTRDLSRAFVDVEIAGLDPADIVMFHVHCGPPGVLGPIIVDFGQFGSLSKTLASGKLSVELADQNLTYLKDMPHGLKPALPESCPPSSASRPRS